MDSSEDIDLNIIENSLYFGSYDNLVHLSAVKGSTFTFAPGSLEKTNDFSSHMITLSFRNPVGYLGKEYNDHFLPCVPASDIHQSLALSRLKQNSIEPGDISKLDEEVLLKLPLIKTGTESAKIVGFRSGKRSAIIKTSDGHFYRLKGCGNLLEGFPISKGRVNLDPNSEELRGCQFFHTAKREQIISSQVDEILKPYGGHCGNLPMGYWLYDQDFENGDTIKELKLKNERKLVGKFCGLFKTLGEKRLATHLLQGLEMIIFTICSESDEVIDLIKTSELFPKDRVHEKTAAGGENVGYSFDLTPIPIDDYLGEMTLKQRCVKGFFKLPEQESYYVNLLNAGNRASIISKNTNSSKERLKHIFEILKKKVAVSENYSKLFDVLSERLLQFLPDTPLEGILFYFAKIYARAGWEAGFLKRLFIDKGVNWGYYFDHHPFLAHCNAHPNNFVILPEGTSENLLAPVDFDMAFDRDEFINIDSSSKNYGVFDEECFESYLSSEKYSFELLLTGAENMENFKYNDFDFKNASDSKQQQIDALLCMLRDTLRIYYMRGFEKGSPLDEDDLKIKNDNGLHTLVKLSLILTNKYLG